MQRILSLGILLNIVLFVHVVNADAPTILTLTPRRVQRTSRLATARFLKRDVNTSEPLLEYFNVTDLQ